MKHHRLNGPALAACREAAGLSQAQLAERCGISGPYLSMIENGRKQPSAPVAQRLAEQLGVLLADIARPRERRRDLPDRR